MTGENTTKRGVWERFFQMKIERLCMLNSSTLIKVFVTSVCTHGLMLLTNLSSFSNHDEYCGAKKEDVVIENLLHHLSDLIIKGQLIFFTTVSASYHYSKGYLNPIWSKTNSFMTGNPIFKILYWGICSVFNIKVKAQSSCTTIWKRTPMKGMKTNYEAHFFVVPTQVKKALKLCCFIVSPC